MGDIARALAGGGTTIEHDGQVLKMSPITYEIQAAFEEYLEGEAWRTYRRACQHLPPDEAKELRAETARDIAAGAYSWAGPTTVIASKCLRHLKQLLWLMLRDNLDSVNGQQPDLRKVVDAIVERDLNAAIEAINAANLDPTRPASNLERAEAGA